MRHSWDRTRWFRPTRGEFEEIGCLFGIIVVVLGIILAIKGCGNSPPASNKQPAPPAAPVPRHVMVLTEAVRNQALLARDMRKLDGLIAEDERLLRETQAEIRRITQGTKVPFTVAADPDQNHELYNLVLRLSWLPELLEDRRSRRKRVSDLLGDLKETELRIRHEADESLAEKDIEEMEARNAVARAELDAPGALDPRDGRVSQADALVRLRAEKEDAARRAYDALFEK